MTEITGPMENAGASVLRAVLDDSRNYGNLEQLATAVFVAMLEAQRLVNAATDRKLNPLPATLVHGKR